MGKMTWKTSLVVPTVLAVAPSIFFFSVFYVPFRSRLQRLTLHLLVTAVMIHSFAVDLRAVVLVLDLLM